MGRVRTDPKYIGSALRNDVEVGDEVCVKFEDGTYMNREVTGVHQQTKEEGEVTIGDVDNLNAHAILGWSAHEDERAVNRTEIMWDVWAYQLTEDPDEVRDFGEIEAFYIVGDAIRSPDITMDEALESRDDAEDMRTYDQMREVLRDERQDLKQAFNAIGTLLGWVDDLEAGDITMREFEIRMDTLDVKYGGNLPFTL